MPYHPRSSSPHSIRLSHSIIFRPLRLLFAVILSGAQLGMQAAPAAAAPLQEVLATCFTLTLSISGNGLAPTADPVKSAACPTAGQYEAGEVITLTAAPDLGYRVLSWAGTADDSSTATTNTVTMPALDHAVTVNYGVLASS